MSKLSKIFESVDKTTAYEKNKRKYFANKLKESFLLTEGLSSKGYPVEKVENKIFNEAIRYGSEKESLAFIKGIEQEIYLDEGFMDKVKAAGTWVKDKIVGLAGAVRDWWNGPIVTALRKFSSTVTPLAKKLQSTGRKPLSDSVMSHIPYNHSYLMEEELALDGAKPTETTPTATPTEAPAEAATAESAPVPGGVQYMADLLFAGKKLPSGWKTGSTQKRVKFFAITKSGTNSTLWVGPSSDIKQMNVLAAYMKSSGKLFFNLSESIVSSQLEMELVANLFTAIKNNSDLNPDGVYKSVTQKGKKVVLDQAGKLIQIIPNKLVIMGVGGKAKSPIKVKGATEPAVFMDALGIAPQAPDTVEGGEDTDITDQAARDKKEGKPNPENFKDKFGKVDEVKYQAAMDAWSNDKDSANFGTDNTTNDYMVDLEQKINTFFGMSHDELIKHKLDDVVGTVFEKTPKVVEDINEYNDNIATVLEYFAGEDGKLTPEDAKELTGDLSAIAEVAYSHAIKRSVEAVATPEEKQAVLDRGVNLVGELQKIAKSFNVNFTFDKDYWKEAAGGLEIKDWQDETNYGPTGEPIPGSVDPETAAAEEEIEAAPATGPKLLAKTMAVLGKSKTNPQLAEKLGVDPAGVWAGFLKFADAYNNDLADILMATNDSGKHDGMTNNQFIAYAATLDKVLGALVNDEKVLTSQPYYPEALRTFINDSKDAAGTLSDYITMSTVKAAPTDDTGKIGAKPGTPAAVTGAPAAVEKTVDELKKAIDALTPEQLNYVLAKVEK